MKKIILFGFLLTLTASADFFKTEEKILQEAQAEKARLCQLFTQKAIDYEKNMREDELARITLQSYKKRTKIYCSTEDKNNTKVKKTVEKVVAHTKNIALENERLCKLFQDKIIRYKKNMREDALADTTLASYKKRAYVFCSDKSLEKKEKGVLQEEERLCQLFNQGPSLCRKFDKKIVQDSNSSLSKMTLQSYKKRASVFCSSSPLKKKDEKVYAEHKRLCKVFNEKIIAYKKNMRDDDFAKATLKSYKKRAAYFCGGK